MTPIRKEIDLWYSGLGKEYHASRGPLAAVGCHDGIQTRKTVYISVGLSMLAMAGTCMVAAWVIRLQTWLAAICVLVAAFAGIQAFLLFKAYHILKTAHLKGSDPDTADPIRIKAIHSAYRWGIKKRFISKDASGKEYFSK